VSGAAFDVTGLDAAQPAIGVLAPVDILVNNVGHRDRRGVAQLLPADPPHRRNRQPAPARGRVFSPGPDQPAVPTMTSGALAPSRS
jgi:hypothetical protein